MSLIKPATPEIYKKEVKTRSGRVSKIPDRLELFEEVEDDYSDGDYETESDVESESELDLLQSDTEDFCEDESEEDENGNLKGFVVSDNEDNYDSGYENE